MNTILINLIIDLKKKVFIITYLIALFQKAMEPGGDLAVSMAGWVSSFIPADSFFSENLSF